MEPKTPPADQPSDRIPIRVTPTQKAMLTEGARRFGADVSTFLRVLGLEKAAALGVTEATVTVEREAPAKSPARPRKGGGR